MVVLGPRRIAFSKLLAALNDPDPKRRLRYRLGTGAAVIAVIAIVVAVQLSKQVNTSSESYRAGYDMGLTYDASAPVEAFCVMTYDVQQANGFADVRYGLDLQAGQVNKRDFMAGCERAAG